MPSTGNWFGSKNDSTGTSLLYYVPRYVLAATLLIGAGTVASIDDLDSLRHHQDDKTISRPLLQTYIYTRTPDEDIARIREVFSPAISDLAKAFNVSRQSIYNWLHGEQPISAHKDKLHNFALAADIFAETKISMTGTLLKRKIIDGKSLLDIVRDGGSATDAALLLKKIVQHENSQREMLAARFAGRATTICSTDSDLIAENDAV